MDDNISRLTSISDSTGTLESYAYQGEGTVLERNHSQPGLNLTTTLDDFGRISDFNWTNSGGSVSHYAYGYDAAGNRLYKEDLVNSGLSELYGYDNLYQLTSFARGTLNSTKDAITGTPDYSQSWNHDALGNWDDVTTNGVTEDRDSNAQNEYTDVDGNSPAYDANGNMTTDQDGKQFVWDPWNRLVEVQDSSSVTLKTYTYDSLNRRVTDSDGTTTKNLFYSTSWQVVLESAGEPTGTTTGMTRYVWSPVYVDAMILRDRDADNNGTLDERLWAVQDANFNMMALVDNSGSVVERFKYTPFGVATVMDASGTVLTASAYGWVYLHQGLRLEVASGLYDNRFRWCSATLGRFVSADPLRFAAGDVNLQRYESNGSTNRTDPEGLKDYSVSKDATHLHIVIAAFIPKRLGVWLPDPSGSGEVMGDDRDFGGCKFDSRIRTDFYLPLGTIGQLNFNPMDGDPEYPATYPGVSYRRDSKDAKPEKAVSQDTKTRRFKWITFDGTSTLAVRGMGSYPFAKISPSIDYTVTFKFKSSSVDGKRFVDINTSVSHDAFPDYEIYVIPSAGPNALAEPDPIFIHRFKSEHKGPALGNLNQHLPREVEDKQLRLIFGK